MINKIKLLLLQTMMISFAILFLIVVQGALFHLIFGTPLNSFSLDWTQLLSILLSGAVCSVPTVIFLDEDTGKKEKYWPKIVLHCIGLYIVIVLMGYIFKWYTEAAGFIAVSVMFFAIYVFVWFATLWFRKQDDKKINKALDDIRDEE